ncbi:DUF4350 domain-containing protein [Microbacterium sp. CIAB417]|uniref:DUF4350 domain-containing protein n=1 Tax=Microbacterium sp. CIAB417 TaxID=2860287 RepID=UPI001FAD82CE|nr:DUF4350 domain-containing protein [Microbacterium sp. CIAB417]
MTDTATRPDGSSTAAAAPRRARRWIGWILVVLLVIGAASVVLLVSQSASVPFRGGGDPDGTGEHGTLALAEILRDQGIEVDVVRSRTQAVSEIRDDTTLVMTDPYSLSDEAVAALIEPANRTVFLSASSRILDLLDLGEGTTASTSAAVTASCDLPELAEIGTIHPGRLFVPADGVTGCFPDADGNAALLVDDSGGARTVLIDGSRLFGNGYLAEDGNAALGLALLGQTGHVVWYVPSLLDSDLEAQTDPSLGDLTPDWVTPAIVMLILAGAAAAVWRGRRFGPLVAETLPVTVRASETMHGRARLTARAADAEHAGAALRDGTVRRLARRLGLHERAGAAEVADAAADRLRVPRTAVQALLTGPLPASDDALIDDARRLADLEASVDAAVHAERGAS